MIVTFTVEGARRTLTSPTGKKKVIDGLPGKNRKFLTGTHRHVMSPDMRAFKDAIIRAAKAARDASSWPKALDTVKAVRVTVQAFNCRYDAGAFDETVRDALQGVFYLNDKIVAGGPQELTKVDKGSRRIEVVVQLLTPSGTALRQMGLES